jgi:LacI family transcriptional regulator
MISPTKNTQLQKRLVVAVIATNAIVGRAELRGVEMAASRMGWTLETIDPAQTGPDLTPFAPLLDRADGVIARENDILDRLCGLVRPETSVVVIDTWHERANARVACDIGKVAEIAAEELMALRRRCYVFVPMPRARRWTAKRGEAFVSRIRAAGHEARCYEPQTEWGWAKERDALAKWLSTLPRPLAAFAGNDFLAKFTLDACRDAGLEVPRDVAILGADDDETLCLSSTPTLSSIRVDFEGAGRLAAERLAALMGKPPPKRVEIVRYGTLGVARRGSTRSGDPGTNSRMAAGLDFIAAHSYNPLLGVRDIAAAMGTGRRQAERLFRSTGKSIRQCVEDTRMEQVCLLLKTTSMPLRAIAEECGFSSRPYLSRVFKKRFGKTPGEWRHNNA